MEPDKNQSPQIFPKFIVAVFLFILGIWIGRNIDIPFFPEPETPKYQVLNRLNSKDNLDFSTFWEAWDKLNASYLNKKDLTGEKLLQGAIDGMITAVGDPYTSYYDPESNNTFNKELSGKFEGVGMELGVSDNQLVVIAPLDDSPASKAGILAGDRIVAIEGKDASKFTIADAVSIIRGKAGTKVKITFLRKDKVDPFEIELTRATINVKSIKTKFESDKAIITITRFGENTKSEWDSVVNELATKGIKKLILDLRNNPGGQLDTAINIAGEFVSQKDAVVQQEDSDGKRQQFYAKTDGRLQGAAIVVLINKGSASASEIVAGALKDYKKAKIIGENSFGKGTVQAVTNLKDGSGLHITVAKWLTPNGSWVHGKGIKPDFEVVLTEEDISAGQDPQMQKALDLLK